MTSNTTYLPQKSLLDLHLACLLIPVTRVSNGVTPHSGVVCTPARCAETNFPAGINLGQRPTPHSQPPICTLVAEALVYNTCGNRIVPTNLPQCDSLQAINISCSAQEEGSHWDGKHLRSVPKKRHFLLCFLTFSERLPDSDTSKLYNGSRVSLSSAWVL